MVVPYNTNEPKKNQIRKMFNHIAEKYDFLNRLLSLGNDKCWRRKTVKILKEIKGEIPVGNVIDLATGTGVLAETLLKLNPQGKVYGVDIAENMIEVARKKYLNEPKLVFEVADGENLPYNDDFFDIATIGFGIRNYNHIEKGIKETYRVLREHGIIAILELSVPKNPLFKLVHELHSSIFIPLVGFIFAGDLKAYSYLHNSVKEFSRTVNLVEELEKAGFKIKVLKTFTFGTVTLYIGEK